jgi:hypothetical protein
MTLAELQARGVMAVRRLEWAYPNQHVVLVRDALTGAYSALGVLMTPADEASGGVPTASEVVLASLGPEDDRWEPYEPKV